MIDPHEWLAADPDPETRAELETLIAARDRAAIDERFAQRLVFGTAGLRGALGAGPNRMNRVVVRMAAAALARHIAPDSARAGTPPLVVVGYDARKNSDVFARDTAAVIAGAGGRALVVPGPSPTPLLAFAVRALAADAGVMVTASHNPPNDNGYKVYLGDGAQIVPPHDREIEALIATGGLPPRELPRPRAGGASAIYDGDLAGDYLRAVVPEADIGQLRIAYTPLHGVGYGLFQKALERAGARCTVVAEQAQPDGRFPTVAFPNPEEPGALDLGLDIAREIGADVLIAHDPDADRLAVALPAPRGQWRVLTGNEVGALLGDHLLRTTSGADRLVASSLVSSSLLGKMARQHGVRHVETLTGFKWIVRPAIDDPALRFVFGYEEALGYAVNDVVRDKDGISAALVFLQMMTQCAPLERLDELAREYGQHVTRQRSVRLTGKIALDRVASDGLAGAAVTQPADDIVRFDFAGGSRVLIRPSGTEPKLKIYIEVVSDYGDARAGERAERLAGEAEQLARRHCA